MKYQEVIDYYGSAKEAATALGVTHQCVYNWQNHFPRGSQAIIELATNGKLKADQPKKKTA